MKILALDLSKYKTVACDYEAETARHSFVTVLTTPKALHDLIVECEPDRVVIEICSIAGWVCDLVRTLGIEIQVANTADERWRWRKIKQKSDRRDALKAAQLSAVNQLGTVHVPQQEVRQWRALIAYRQKLVQRRTRMRNHLRDLLQREGMILPRGRTAWTQVGMGNLQALVRPLTEVAVTELWRGELGVELAQLRELQQQIQTVEAKLDELGAADCRVQLLQTIPGVGPRLAAAVKSALTSAWCPNNSTPARRNVPDTSRAKAIGWCVHCWWKWPGPVCGTIPGRAKLTNASTAARSRARRSPSSQWAENC